MVYICGAFSGQELLTRQSNKVCILCIFKIQNTVFVFKYLVFLFKIYFDVFVPISDKGDVSPNSSQIKWRADWVSDASVSLD